MHRTSLDWDSCLFQSHWASTFLMAANINKWVSNVKSAGARNDKSYLFYGIH